MQPSPSQYLLQYHTTHTRLQLTHTQDCDSLTQDYSSLSHTGSSTHTQDCGSPSCSHTDCSAHRRLQLSQPHETAAHTHTRLRLSQTHRDCSSHKHTETAALTHKTAASSLTLKAAALSHKTAVVSLTHTQRLHLSFFHSLTLTRLQLTEREGLQLSHTERCSSLTHDCSSRSLTQRIRQSLTQL